MAEIKFCGLTRAEDAAYAAELGATYTGVIFAGGPRMLTIERAAGVFAGVPRRVKRVGVFADQTAAEIAATAIHLGLDVVQLHGAFDCARIDELRARFDGDVWSVCRIAGSALPGEFALMAQASNAVLLDAFVPGALGGTGVTVPWADIGREIDSLSMTTAIVLAGGLRPENVASAIAQLAPAVVDVSSGVESAPGIKDHDRMRAFRDAVSHSGIST